MADEEARRAEQVKQAKAELERQRLLDHLAKIDEERKQLEADAIFEEEVAARVAERERERRADERIAKEEADARRRAADQRLMDDLRRERIDRERIEEERRAEEERLARLRDRVRPGRRSTRFDDMW